MKIFDKFKKIENADIKKVIFDYSKSLTLLDDYDRESFKIIKGTKTDFKLTYEECLRVISAVREQFDNEGEREVFALEKDNSFKSVIDNLYQTYNNEDLYKTTEEKAANLFYLLAKDHPFVGGNKRIAAIIFAYFIEKTNLAREKNGERKINDSGIIALTLLIAESNPDQKDLLIKLIKNLLV
ncbi:MAG: Fic family protein [Minisyncoccia bacterium]